MTDLWQRLKQHKLVQWALAYLAAGWALLQALGLAVDSYEWPHDVMRIAFAAIAQARSGLGSLAQGSAFPGAAEKREHHPAGCAERSRA